MQEIVSRNLCAGCGACRNSCPTRSISMEMTEGFLYPVIHTETCTDCGRCQDVCPALHHDVYSNAPLPKAYAAHQRDDAALEHCSSGGVFQLLAQDILGRGGVVFGAAFDRSFQVVHRAARSWAEAAEFQPSKYVQSAIGRTYQEARAALDDGRPVLFTGTPCQISGLKCFLGRDDPNLLCQDIVCHSVPSPRAWADYLEQHAQKHHSGIQNVTFRKKEPDWEGYHFQITFENGAVYNCPGSESTYMKAFLRGLISRPSCYSCPFKGLHRDSDITLADFWGVRQACPSAFHAKGTSLVLVHTPKGMDLLQRVAPELSIQEVDPREAVAHNPAAVTPAGQSDRYERFWARYTGENLEALVGECLKPTVQSQLKQRLRQSPVTRAVKKIAVRFK